MTKISIIVIEYYSLDEIEACITKILKTCSNFNYELIVSSNSCYAEPEIEKIKSNFPSAKWIFNNKNGGFAYAMNKGMEYANGDFILIMNPDVLIKKGIEDMIAFAESHPEIGIVAPQILDKNNTIQDSCRPYISVQAYLWRQIERIFTKQEIIYDRRIDYSKVQTIDWVIGACMLVNYKAYKKTMGFDEQYFLYVEDMDWCTRTRKAGFEIVYYPKAVVEYKGSRAARKNRKYAKIFMRSMFIFWKKFGFFFGYPKREKKYF